MTAPVDLSIPSALCAELALRLEANSIPEPNTGCRLWLMSTTRFGYGMVSIKGHGVSAHRVAYYLAYGAIPTGLCVLHRCDEPSCVEPTHLWVGTCAENNKDRNAKGRAARGDQSGPRRHPDSYRGMQNSAAKMTVAKVRKLRARAAKGDSWRELARMFGISKRQAGNIIHRKSWGYVL